MEASGEHERYALINKEAPVSIETGVSFYHLSKCPPPENTNPCQYGSPVTSLAM